MRTASKSMKFLNAGFSGFLSHFYMIGRASAKIYRGGGR
jgi:hypothetical protein